MKDKIASLLKNISEFPVGNKNLQEIEALAVVRRSLESIKMEMSLGTPVEPAIVDRIEANLLRLQNKFKDK